MDDLDAMFTIMVLLYENRPGQLFENPPFFNLSETSYKLSYDEFYILNDTLFIFYSIIKILLNFCVNQLEVSLGNFSTHLLHPPRVFKKINKLFWVPVLIFESKKTKEEYNKFS